MIEEELVNDLYKIYGIKFRDLKLLKLSFIHSSYANEYCYLKHINNERLEFLGDAVLELLVSQYLYKKFPNFSEGDLTKMRAFIVCEENLSKISKKCKFDKYVLLGNGERNSGGKNRISLLCDVFEAFLGSLYLDQGIIIVENFIKKVIFSDIDLSYFFSKIDYKTSLQEFLQKFGKMSIEYKLAKENGPAHKKKFFIKVFVNGKYIGIGNGMSKKTAEQNAAKNALEKLK